MAHRIIDMDCPGCGNPVNTGDQECCYCGRKIIISTFNSVYNMPMPEVNKYVRAYRKELVKNEDNQQLNNSIAMCYLKLRLYDKGLEAFEKAMEDNFDNSETFFYAAICVLKGKKAFLAIRSDINKIEEYINAALMIEPRGIYYYFQSYIKYDYFFRKFFTTSPTWEESLSLAQSTGFSSYDVDQFYNTLGVNKPDCL